MARTLAIGDIHGCSKALDLVLEQVKPCAADQVITLGDHIDRGPDSAGVIERLIELGKRCPLMCLRGNHEIMMLAARTQTNEECTRLWLGYGGRETLASYAKSLLDGRLEDVPEHHWQFLASCRPWFETDTHIFVHANVYPYLPLVEQPDGILFWEMFQDMGPHESGKIVICGHTSQKSGVPRALPHAVCLDTWVYGNGWLTCYDLGSGRIWQANQRGESRAGYLDEMGIR